MTVPTVVASTDLARPDNLFTSIEETALSGFLAGYSALDPRGVHVGSAPVRSLVHRTRSGDLRCAPRRHRELRPTPRSLGSRPRHHQPTAVHHHVLLPLRRTRRTHRPLARGPRASTAPGLRVPRDR